MITVEAMIMSCVICGRRPGVKKMQVSENFVSYSELHHGSLICEICAKLLEDQNYRRSSWILVGDELKVLSKKELLDVLQDPPERSVIYVKSSGRRYGFLRGLKYMTTKNMVVLCSEDEGVVFVERNKLKQLVKLAKKAYSVLGRKKDLLCGCSVGNWVHKELCEEIEKVRGDPVWEIVVRAL
jgi:hypothetical protein